jgi:hypothetical protein
VSGVSALWVLGNVSYAGMRAQGKKRTETGRTISFVCGFPGTLVTYFCVDYGSKRAYGVELPTIDDSDEVTLSRFAANPAYDIPERFSKL